MIYIGLDDTDNHESRGTGHLARQIASQLKDEWLVCGVTRHQLFLDPRIPYTKKNSCACIMVEGREDADLDALLARVRRLMLDDYQPGSDPGLCVASAVAAPIVCFGLRAKSACLTQEDARYLASICDVALEGLGGTEDGVIGAIAAVGLAASGDDGRYVLVGGNRELSGLQSVTQVAKSVATVRTLDGALVAEGAVVSDKLRPARRNGRPVLFVEPCGDHWQPLKLD